MKTRPAESAGPANGASGMVQVAEMPAKRAGLKMNRILVPVDFSECSLRALSYALHFAEQFHARLIVLHVVEPAVVERAVAIGQRRVVAARLGVTHEVESLHGTSAMARQCAMPRS